MASSLLLLLDDIATLMKDAAAMTKVATKKTAGVLGDDLALNAQQVTGISPERELPVVWAVAKGSLVNKAILVPAALAISTFMPWAVTPLMMIGGAFLCFEGVEKIAHKFLHTKAEEDAHHAEILEPLQDETIDVVAHEKERIKGAVRTDFILSAEIIVITLGTVAAQPFSRQLAVLVAIALLMTVGVYGIVGAIVKLDDMGLYLSRRQGAGSAGARRLGAGILWFAPLLMRFLSIAGTAAMFLVGGGIVVHAVPPLHHAVEAITPAWGPAWLVPTLAEGVVGVLIGIAVLAAVMGIRKLRGLPAVPPH
jgi:predicted DNA repair protein MutK